MWKNLRNTSAMQIFTFHDSAYSIQLNSNSLIMHKITWHGITFRLFLQIYITSINIISIFTKSGINSTHNIVWYDILDYKPETNL